MPAFTLHEWKALPHGDGDGCIPLHLADQLARIAKASTFAGRGEDGVLEHRRTELRARGIVGVIAAPGCSLEILPKIDMPEAPDAARQNAAIRKRLVHMLAVARDLKIDIGQISEHDWQKETLLEILIRIFCTKLSDAVRRGMPRRYIGHEDDLPALRGALDVSRQFTHHAANPSRLACRYDELSPDTTLNRIMKAAVSHLMQTSSSQANQQSLRELAFVYADVSAIPPSALRREDVVLDRTNLAWSELLGMARLFLNSRYQTTGTGSGQGTALLFEMNTLFEEYVGRMLFRALAGTEYSVSLQGGHRFCLTSLEDERLLFRTKPDILIRHAGEVVHVIDTKWKRMSARVDDPKQGVSQADIYQMMAYARLYGAPRLTLFYPHHAGLPGEEGVQARYRIADCEQMLHAASFDVSRGARVLDRLRELIL